MVQIVERKNAVTLYNGVSNEWHAYNQVGNLPLLEHRTESFDFLCGPSNQCPNKMHMVSVVQTRHTKLFVNFISYIML